MLLFTAGGASLQSQSTTLPSAVNRTGAEVWARHKTFRPCSRLGQSHFWLFTDFSGSAFIYRCSESNTLHWCTSHLFTSLASCVFDSGWSIHDHFCDWVIWLTSFILTSLTYDDAYFTESWDYFFALYWSTINALVILDCISCAF